MQLDPRDISVLWALGGIFAIAVAFSVHASLYDRQVERDRKAQGSKTGAQPQA